MKALTNVHTSMPVYAHIHSCMHAHTDAHTQMCARTHSHTHTQHTHARTCTHTHTYAYTHACTHTNTHTHLHCHNLARFNVLRNSDGIRFLASEANTISCLPIHVLQWYDAHANQVATMNTLITLSYHCSNALGVFTKSCII